jgi:hypothetical protein
LCRAAQLIRQFHLCGNLGIFDEQFVRKVDADLLMQQGNILDA